MDGAACLWRLAVGRGGVRAGRLAAIPFDRLTRRECGLKLSKRQAGGAANGQNAPNRGIQHERVRLDSADRNRLVGSSR
jgi:hypothetical protein